MVWPERALTRSGEPTTKKTTTTPEPTDKLDAAAIVVVNGPADETLQASGSYGVTPSDLNGLLEPGAVKVAPAPRGAKRKEMMDINISSVPAGMPALG